jgi:hypothetical protein
MDTDDDLTDDHMRLLAWLAAHPTGSLTAHQWERAVMNWSDVDTHPNSSSMVSSDAS